MGLFTFLFGKPEIREDLNHLDTVRVNIIDLEENYTKDWIVGRDIPRETYERFVDPETGELYVVIHYDNGRSFTKIVPKSIWNTARLSMVG